MGISVGGLASGIDTETVITQLLELEQQPIIDLQSKIAVAEAKSAAYSDLNGRLNSLRSAARKLNDENLFGKLSGSSSDTSVLTVSTSTGASVGSHRIKVNQIATAHRMAAQGFVDTSATGVAAGDGKFTFKVGGGDEVSLDVDESMTLRQLADAINAKKAGVRADIVNDATATNPYRLVLTAEDEGRANTIHIVENDTMLDFANKRIEAAVADSENNAAYTGQMTSSGTYTGTANTAYVVEIMTGGAADGTAKFRYSSDGGQTFVDNGGAGFNVTSAGPIELANGVQVNFTNNGVLTQGDSFSIDVFSPELDTPQDAIMEVNGITVRSDTNTVTNLFEGVTFNLLADSEGKTINVNLSRNNGDIETALTSFVGAYNSIIGYLNTQFSYNPKDEDAGSVPPLNGDSAARQIQASLRRFVGGRMSGLSSDTLSALSEVGFSSDQTTGLASLDTSVLQTKLKDDPVGVQRLLTRFGEASEDARFTYLRRSSDSKPGSYKVEVTQARTRAEVKAGAAAQTLTADETLTIKYNSRADLVGSVPKDIQVELKAGDTADAQVSRINQAFEDANVQASAFLDAQGKLSFRTGLYGAKQSMSVQSSLAAGAGTSNVGNDLISDVGTDLKGTIGGRPARVVDDNHLKGEANYDTEDIEVLIADDTIGSLGYVRISDGMGEALPDIIDGLTTGDGILESRTDGLGRTIEDLEEQLQSKQDRLITIEERYRKQFAALEVTMGQLSSLGDYVTQQLAGLNSSND